MVNGFKSHQGHWWCQQGYTTTIAPVLQGQISPNTRSEKKPIRGFPQGMETLNERELSSIAHVYVEYDHHIKKSCTLITAHVSSELHANYKNRFCYYVHNDAYRIKFYIYGLPY